MQRKAALVFSDGSSVIGDAFGASAERVGELVFNTSMTGYQEALTDPSYSGQVLIFSYPLIGNYGFSASATESKKVWAEGVVVSEACVSPSHYASLTSFSDYLEKLGVPGISGVDTRALVRKIRQEGVQPVAIKTWDAFPEPEMAKEVKILAKKAKNFAYSVEHFVSAASTKETVTYVAKKQENKVVLVDCGAKASIAADLLARDISVILVPFDTSAKKILELSPDGVLFSNGPGDPEILKKTVQTCKDLLGKKPIFGVCLGHQILAQALGGRTYKLKFGHRGSNHAVEDIRTGKIYITAQNHGFAVEDIPKKAEWMRNCLDGTNEGINTDDAFSVQFHPEANPGPNDSNPLFDEFKKRITC